jgi:aryl-alcohol dehydrogenase-like predicted oxidoreductase
MSKAVVFSILFQLCAILTNSQIDCFYHCSLKRLGTDYIDIYQLHWPDRYVPMFGDVDYNPSSSYKSVPIEEQLQVLAAAIDAGKIRHVGVSNETAFGIMEFCRLAKYDKQLPQIVSIQVNFLTYFVSDMSSYESDSSWSI